MLVTTAAPRNGAGWRTGLAFRSPFGDWLDASPGLVESVEVLAEHFHAAGRGRLRRLSERHSLSIHTERLSLGTCSPADDGELARLANLVRECRPRFVSDHLGFSRTAELDLGTPVPMLLDDRALERTASRVAAAMDACGVRLLVENLAEYLPIGGSMPVPVFLDRLCGLTGCGVLLDATALHVDAINGGIDPRVWLDALDPRHIVQVHVGGCSERGGCWIATSSEPVPEAVWTILARVVERSPVEDVILVRDGGWPAAVELEAQLRRVRRPDGSGKIDDAPG